MSLFHKPHKQINLKGNNNNKSKLENNFWL